MVSNEFKGRVAVVTGAGKRTGIGYAIAKQLAQNGAHVVITDLGVIDGGQQPVPTGTSDEMTEIVEELSGLQGMRSMAVNMDVGSGRSIADMIAIVSETFPRIDILCNNAGASFGVPNAVHTYDEAAWMKTIDINLHGVFRVSHAVIPLMTGGGVIVNTASRAGKVPAIFNGAYAVAKAGVIMLTKVMAAELAGMGIRVNAVCPGQIMTDLEKWRFNLEAQFFNTTAEARESEMCKSIPLGRIGKPAEVAQLVRFLASDASSYMTGQAVNVTGGQLMEL